MLVARANILTTITTVYPVTHRLPHFQRRDVFAEVGEKRNAFTRVDLAWRTQGSRGTGGDARVFAPFWTALLDRRSIRRELLVDDDGYRNDPRTLSGQLVRIEEVVLPEIAQSGSCR